MTKHSETCDRCKTTYGYEAGIATLRIAVATGKDAINWEFSQTGDLNLCKACAAPIIQALSPLLELP